MNINYHPFLLKTFIIIIKPGARNWGGPWPLGVEGSTPRGFKYELNEEL